MLSWDEDQVVKFVFMDGYSLSARVMCLTREAFEAAALVKESGVYPPDDDVRSATDVVFTQPSNSMTIVAHAFGRDYAEVLHGQPGAK